MALFGDDQPGSAAAAASTWVSWFRDKSQIVAVATSTAASQAVAAVSSWFSPSTSNRFFVDRADAAAYARVQAWDGSSWSALIEGDTGWVAATKDAAWDTYSTLASRRVGPLVVLAGLARPDTGTITASATTGLIATLASGHRPAADIYRPITQWVNGGTPELRADAIAEIKSNGEVRVINGSSSAATGAHFGTVFTVD